MSQDNLKPNVGVQEATHVQVNGRIYKISSKWGVRADGRLAKPSEGGFGVVTEDGLHISMWHVERYFKEEKTV